MTQVLERETVHWPEPMDRLRIVVVQQGGALGGAERWQFHLAEATDRLAVEVISLGAGPAADAWEERGVPVSRIPVQRGGAQVPLTAARVDALVRRSHADVILAHGVKPALAAAPSARAHGIPLVWVRHDGSFGGWPVALLDRVSVGQIATGAWLFDGRRPGNPLLLNPPRIAASLDRTQARSELGLGARTHRLLAGMGTRIVQGKGIDDAIRALADPAAAAWDLAIGGIQDPEDPGEQERLIALAADLGVGDRVRFLGEIDFARLCAAFDCVLVLTKPTESKPWHREAFGMAAFEAMTAGVAVVGTPPLGAMIHDGGVEVRPGSPGDVAAALLGLGDPDVRRRCGAAAARVVSSYPDAAAAADTFVDFLAEVADRPGAGLAADSLGMTVVVTTLDDNAGTLDLLSALVAQLAPTDEVIVVDRGSGDSTTEVVASFAAFDSRVRLVVEPGASVARARNIAVRVAAHDRIACTDAGFLPGPGWAAAFRRAFAGIPGVDLWTGATVVPREPWERALQAVGDTLSERWPLQEPAGLTLSAAHSFAFARVAWARVGGFREDLQPEAADVVFSREIASDGGRIERVPDAAVSQSRRPTLRASLTAHRKQGAATAHVKDLRLTVIELARATVYAVAAGAVMRGSTPARATAAAGLLALHARPIARALQGPSPARTASLVPPAAVAGDLAMIYGTLTSLGRRGSSRP